MGFLDRLFGTNKPADPPAPEPFTRGGPKVTGEAAHAVSTGRLTSRLPGGSVVVDLRKASMDDLLSTAAFSVTDAELRALSPAGIVCWMLPAAAIDAWNAKDNFVEVTTAWMDGGGCVGQTCTVICGTPTTHTAAWVHVLRSMGHQVFEGAAEGAAPILEVSLSTGQMTAGISAKAVP
ncbi:MAG: hypothetical protein Q8K32_31930 [Archangium sp.]|nr:hypothetical protein [Archangium sp.]